MSLGDALDAIFTDPFLAEEAIWSAEGIAPGVPIRIVRRTPDRVERFGDSRALLGSLAVDVRRSDAPTIAEGDTVEIDGTSYRVMAEPVGSALDLVLTVELAPT